MIIYTGGTFDLFHYGHVNFLRECHQLCTNTRPYIYVSLNTDWFIERFKGKPPIMSYNERRIVLEGCRYVDKVIPNTGGHDSKIAIRRVKPDFIIIGDDWLDKDYMKQMDFDEDWLSSMGIELVYVPYTREISSTEIKKRCKKLL